MKTVRFMRLFFDMLFMVCILCFTYSCKENISENREEIMVQLDISPNDDQIEYSPADGSTVKVNPPPFTWLTVKKDVTYPPEYEGYRPPKGTAWVVNKDYYYTYTLQISKDKNFKKGVITRKGIDISTYPLDRSLKPGEWFWRYGVEDGEIIYSKTRSFIVPDDVMKRPFPDIKKVVRSIPKDHPRLFIREDELESFRNRALHSDLKETVSEIKNEIEKHIGEELPAEPKWVKGIGPEFGEHSWRLIYDATVPPLHMAEKFGLAYLLTGEKKFGEEARRRVVHYLKWDPSGSTSKRSQYETSYSIVDQCSRAYDWTYELYTPEERELIKKSMKIRIEELYNGLKYTPDGQYHVYPYGSHPERITGFVGQAAMCFADEWDEAQDWLKYALTIHWNVYPAWAKEDGGWHQGPSYWTGYQGRVQHFIMAVKKATGIDLMQKIFFQNTPYYILYTNPPYAKKSPFGDGQDSPPNERRGEVLYNYSSILNDPYLRWYADYLGASHADNILGVLVKNDDIKGKSPADLPQTRYFPGVGLVSIHTKLGNADEDIHFLFHSDPYGGVSHGHPDQNAFTIEAFGEALALATGYYPWYGSDHHRYWSRQTKSTNNITIDGGKGQRGVSAAKGKIVTFENRDIYDYTHGDATQAYMGLLNKFHRHIIHIRPGVFVMYDDLEAPEPVTFEWLLHALSKMSISESDKSVLIAEGNARLKVNFLQSEKLNFNQVTGFPHPPEYRGETTPDYKDHWHLTVSPVQKSTKAKYITVLVPFKKDKEPKISFSNLMDDTKNFSFELKINEDMYFISLMPEISVKK